MGLTTKTINSSLLGKKMNIAVCVPDAYENIPLPVLYFLHGRTGNETLLQWFEMDKRASSLIESGIIKPGESINVNSSFMGISRKISWRTIKISIFIF